MIPKQHFVNKLRELDFKFNRPGDRVELWRQKGTGKLITVPRRDLIPEAHVRHSLRQCGRGQSEIDAFIAAAKT